MMINNKVIVMNQWKAERYSKENQDKTSVIISITSKSVGPADIKKTTDNKIVDILRLEFNDTDKEDKYAGNINREQAEEIKNFVNKYVNNDSIELFIVHCEAGQSRSAGVAAAIMKYAYNDDTPIFNNRIYTPNMLCYRMVLECLMNI